MNDFADERKLWTGLRLSASSLVLCRNVTIQIRPVLGTASSNAAPCNGRNPAAGKRQTGFPQGR